MCGVIVVDAGRSRSTNLGRDAYNDHCLDIIMIIWSSINFPTAICLPTVCYFSWEKPLVKPTAPGLFLILFAFAIYFFFAFVFRSIIPKNQKIPCYTFSLFILFRVLLRSIYPKSYKPIYLLRGRDWQPLWRIGLQVFILCVHAPFT